MRNLFKYLLISCILCFANTAFSQSYKILYHYKGTAGINTSNISYNVVLTFDRPIVGQYQTTGEGFYNPSIKSDAILNNSLSNVSRSINNQSNATLFDSEVANGDYFSNNIYFNTPSSYNSNIVNFQINYSGMMTSVDLNNGIAAINGSFPINTVLPFTVYKYLDPTTLVESTDPTIISTAKSITSGCTDLRTAILKLCEYIESYILMDGKKANPTTQSTLVLANKYADCGGAAHLLAAFCRSLNIPARIVSGFYIENSYLLPISKTTAQKWGDGNGTQMSGHASCEIYIPSADNWVRCDPAQRTVCYGSQNFIKIKTSSETKGLEYGYNVLSINTNQNPCPQIKSVTLTPSVSISSPNDNYSLVKSETFIGSLKTAINNFLSCAADPNVATGLNDKVTIQDPPTGTTGVPANTSLMTPCLPTSFYAYFLTGSTPATYTTGFDWSIVLYRSDGEEYIYSQQNGLITNVNTPNDYGEGCCWQPTIGALPAYDWLYDPSGNIYGKVKVAVHINDGDTKYDETTIGVSPNNNIQNVTYTTNTTVNACQKLILTNVAITGTPTVIFNTNGQGITINGLFNAPCGSTVIINK